MKDKYNDFYVNFIAYEAHRKLISRTRKKDERILTDYKYLCK